MPTTTQAGRLFDASTWGGVLPDLTSGTVTTAFIINHAVAHDNPADGIFIPGNSGALASDTGTASATGCLLQFGTNGRLSMTNGAKTYCRSNWQAIASTSNQNDNVIECVGAGSEFRFDATQAITQAYVGFPSIGVATYRRLYARSGGLFGSLTTGGAVNGRFSGSGSNPLCWDVQDSTVEDLGSASVGQAFGSGSVNHANALVRLKNAIVRRCGQVTLGFTPAMVREIDGLWILDTLHASIAFVINWGATVTTPANHLVRGIRCNKGYYQAGTSNGAQAAGYQHGLGPGCVLMGVISFTAAQEVHHTFDDGIIVVTGGAQSCIPAQRVTNTLLVADRNLGTDNYKLLFIPPSTVNAVNFQDPETDPALQLPWSSTVTYWTKDLWVDFAQVVLYNDNRGELMGTTDSTRTVVHDGLVVVPMRADKQSLRLWEHISIAGGRLALRHCTVALDHGTVGCCHGPTVNDPGDDLLTMFNNVMVGGGGYAENAGWNSAPVGGNSLVTTIFGWNLIQGEDWFVPLRRKGNVVKGFRPDCLHPGGHDIPMSAATIAAQGEPGAFDLIADPLCGGLARTSTTDGAFGTRNVHTFARSLRLTGTDDQVWDALKLAFVVQGLGPGATPPTRPGHPALRRGRDQDRVQGARGPDDGPDARVGPHVRARRAHPGAFAMAGGGGGGGTTVADVVVSPSNATVAVGATRQLTATVVPGSGQPVTVGDVGERQRGDRVGGQRRPRDRRRARRGDDHGHEQSPTARRAARRRSS
jgi:hypothetical protein